MTRFEWAYPSGVEDVKEQWISGSTMILAIVIMNAVYLVSETRVQVGEHGAQRLLEPRRPVAQVAHRVERRERGHEEVQPREGHQVGGDVGEVRVERACLGSGSGSGSQGPTPGRRCGLGWGEASGPGTARRKGER